MESKRKRKRKPSREGKKQTITMRCKREERRENTLTYGGKGRKNGLKGADAEGNKEESGMEKEKGKKKEKKNNGRKGRKQTHIRKKGKKKENKES